MLSFLWKITKFIIFLYLAIAAFLLVGLVMLNIVI